MDLAATDDNPVPAGAETAGIASAAGGIRLRAAVWRSTRSTSRGTVLLLNGRGEFIEKYYEVIADLRRRGFAVAAFDWRGQGGSDRIASDPRKGHAGRFAEYVGDLSAMLDHLGAQGCPQPYFALAHSMGGAILLHALKSGERRIARGILSAPMVDLHESQSPSYARLAVELLPWLGMAFAYKPGGGPVSPMSKPFDGNILTSDPVRHARSARILEYAPRLGIGDPTISWLRAAYRAMAAMRELEFGFDFMTPLLFVLAGADTLVSSPAANALAERTRGAAAVHILDSRHEILMERDALRDQFWAAFDAFLPGERPYIPPLASAAEQF